MITATVTPKRLGEFANAIAGTPIPLAEWDALTVKQREEVTFGLQERGLVLHRQRRRLVVANREKISRPVVLGPMGGEYCFALDPDELRVEHADEISFHISANSEEEAARILAEFLADLSRQQLDIEPV